MVHDIAITLFTLILIYFGKIYLGTSVVVMLNLCMMVLFRTMLCIQLKHCKLLGF